MAQESERSPSPKKIIEQAARETESAYSKLMDEMEASVPQNGNFFIKVGGKSMPPNNDSSSAVAITHVDTRALILNETRPSKEGGSEDHSEEHVVVTRKGLRILTITPKQFEERTASLGGGGFQKDNSKGKEVISWKNYPDSYLKDIGDEDEQFLEQSLRKSIEEARKTSKTLEGERKKQATARRFSDLLKSLNIQESTGTEVETPIQPAQLEPSPAAASTPLPPAGQQS